MIGITTYVEQARWGVWDLPAAVLPFRYVQRVEAAGGRAVLLPPTAARDGAVLDRLDGMVFAGGADLDPDLYGERAHPETTGLRADRDAAELPLLRAALDRDLPTLGICRGMQLLSVVCGGSLVQHLPDVVGHDGHRPSPGVHGLHDVRLAPGSRVHAILGDVVTVPSYHHQGIGSAGTLAVTGWADDETPEAVEHPDKRFALGVLWHPEVGDDGRLFEALVEAARLSPRRSVPGPLSG